MVEDHSESWRKPAAATWATLSDQQLGFFYIHHTTDRTAHTMAFVRPVVEHLLERKIAQWVHHEGSIQLSIAPRTNALSRSYNISFLNVIPVLPERYIRYFNYI